MPDLVLADDNLTTRQVFELSFADEDIAVHCFESGSEAFAYIQRSPADIVFLNAALRDMDGYELCRRIKADRATSRLSVVILVGAFQAFDQERADNVGCRAHLQKPFETSQLVSLVKEFLGDPESMPEAADDLPAGQLFKIPVAHRDDEVVFQLTPERLRAAAHPLKREITLPPRPSLPPPQPASPQPESKASKPGLRQEDFDRIVERLAQKLPNELRRLLPEIVREISTPGE